MRPPIACAADVDSRPIELDGCRAINFADAASLCGERNYNDVFDTRARGSAFSPATFPLINISSLAGTLRN